MLEPALTWDWAISAGFPSSRCTSAWLSTDIVDVAMVIVGCIIPFHWPPGLVVFG
jgi:hypothetical protein